MRSNLQPTFANYYWKVTDWFPAYATIGHSTSNSYYGSSMLWGIVYAGLRLEPGDQIHALHGGIFAVLAAPRSLVGLPADNVYGITLTISEKSAFEKVYFTQAEQWPLERLAPIAEPTTTIAYHRALPQLKAGQPYGRSIHSVVDCLAQYDGPRVDPIIEVIQK